MAELNARPRARGQLTAIARVRWQLIINSLRKIRGRLELVSRILVGVWFGVIGLGCALGLGAAAVYFVTSGKVVWLAVLLWVVFLFWQLFPLIASAFTETFDSSNLLRFPMSYASYFLVWLAYGSFDPSTVIGGAWLLGIAVGIGIADLRLLPGAAVVLIVFAAFNILLARVIFAWLERWLARRRTREILGVVFCIVIIGFQFIGPLTNRFVNGHRGGEVHFTETFLRVERLLPPGLASEAINRMLHGEILASLGFLSLLGVYAVAFFSLLNIRLRAQFRGENLSEAVARTAAPREKTVVRAGWSLPSVSGQVTAVFEKEFRYLSRSGPMLFTLVVPVLILVLFRLGPTRPGVGPLGKGADLAFPFGAAYASLVLTNFVYNSFGAEGTGIQFLFASPVQFRQILLAKNLAHGAVVGLEMFLVWLAVCLVFQPPSIGVTFATLAAILFAVPVNFAVGNALSLISPKKIDFATFGRQRASGIAQLAGIGTQVVTLGFAGVIFFAARVCGKIWLATIVLLILAAAAFAAYSLVLNRADRLALSHRENLINEISRA
jgi:ABC-2 type transport system permease protein